MNCAVAHCGDKSSYFFVCPYSYRSLGDLSTTLEMTVLSQLFFATFFEYRHFDQVKRVEKSPTFLHKKRSKFCSCSFYPFNLDRYFDNQFKRSFTAWLVPTYITLSHVSTTHSSSPPKGEASPDAEKTSYLINIL